jgi:hypothetical protein
MDYGLLGGLGEGLQKGVAAYMEGRKVKKSEEAEAEKTALARREAKIKELEVAGKLMEAGISIPSGMFSPETESAISGVESQGIPADQPSIEGQPQAKPAGFLPVPSGFKTKAVREAEKTLPTLRLSAMEKGLEPYVKPDGSVDFKKLAEGEKSPGQRRKEAKEGYELSEKEYSSKYGPMDKLRQEWSDHPTTKETGIKNLAYKKILSSQKAGSTAASDMSLIFGFMKLQDPGSTVREGEYATAEQARGLPEGVIAAYNKALKGKKLSPAQREDFVNNAKQIYLAQLDSQEEVNKQYSSLAKSRGLDVEGVVLPTYTTREQTEFKTKKPAGEAGLLPKAQAATPQTTGKVLVSNGKDQFWVDPKDVDEAKREGFKPMSGGK